MRPARSLCTWAAVVGETWPDRLADGATTGPPNARRISRATGCAGTRIATVSSPAVARSATAQSLRLRQHQRQRPRPERLGERHRRRIEAGDPRGGDEIADMGDQRIERGPALGLIEPRDRGGIGGVGAEAVDGLGRERDQPARREAARRRGHGGLARRAESGVFRPTFTGISVLNSASCGVRNPRL